MRTSSVTIQIVKEKQQESVAFRQNVPSHNLQCLPLQSYKHWQLANLRPNRRTIKVKVLSFYFPSSSSPAQIYIVSACFFVYSSAPKLGKTPAKSLVQGYWWDDDMKCFCYFANTLGHARSPRSPTEMWDIKATSASRAPLLSRMSSGCTWVEWAMLSLHGDTMFASSCSLGRPIEWLQSHLDWPQFIESSPFP